MFDPFFVADVSRSQVDDSDMDEETRILELLKLRFGANSLRDCEVMLKDMADSRRITSNIGALASSQSGGGAAAVDQDFSAVILSELFWPPLFEGQVATPAHVQGILDAFGSQYKALKVSPRPHIAAIAAGRQWPSSLPPLSPHFLSPKWVPNLIFLRVWIF